jgi:putative endonuclease
MPKIFTSKKQKTRELGENIACIYLKKQGFKIIERNYGQKWGEIDIIAIKEDRIYFIEVKSVTRVTKQTNHRLKIITNSLQQNVTHETAHQPEENVHPLKLRKIYRTLETYLMDRQVPENVDWQVDLICVYLYPAQKQASIKRIENIVG